MVRNTITARSLTILRLVFILILISGVLYIRNTWIRSKTKTSELALKTAKTAEAGLNGELIKSLHGVAEDIGTKAYESIKARLVEIRAIHINVRFVYIYTQRDGKLYFMADSEPDESEDYSPPGQEYTEARDEDKMPFEDQKAIIQEPYTDRWGTWVSILVPMKDYETGKIIAVFGMDYPAEMWNIEALNKTIQSCLIVLFLFLLVILFYVIINKNIKLLKEKNLSDIAREALRESEERYRGLVRNLDAGVVVHSPDTSIVLNNPRASELLGLSDDQLQGKLAIDEHWKFIDESSIPVPVKEYPVNLIISARKPIKNQILGVIRSQKNDIVWLMINGVPLFDSSGELSEILISFTDITERKQAEEKLKIYTDQIELKNIELDIALTNAEEAKVKANEMTEQAELANKAKSTFLSNMSHEIRTPLNAIIGFSQLMNRDPQITDSQKEYNISIMRAGEHLLILINDILELSKVEAGRVVLNATNVDVQSMFADIQLIFKEQARTKHLQFIFETSEDLPRYILVDENKLRQIFINIIGNAIKFTDEGGIAVRARIDKDVEDSDKLIVEIEDSGAGIPENELNNLFKHFVQTSSGMKKASGTGLGLVLSRELARLMGGDLTVSSQVGKGSLFTFNVQIKTGEKEIIEAHSAKRVLSIDKKSGKVYRILVVDDRSENLQVAVNLLKLVGFETNDAVNGEEAVIKFKDWNPHLILMDMRMPVMDGYEATRVIKSTEKGKKTPIVALTASAFEEEKNEIKSLDIQGYLRKPFKENDLFSTIGKILGIKYLYENETLSTKKKFLNDEEASAENISKLPADLVSDMSHAVSVADLDQLMKLIDTIDPVNSEFAQHLMTLAKSYDYYQLQQILNKKNIDNGK